MPPPVIQVEKLGKQYRIGQRQAQYRTLREAIVERIRRPFDWLHQKQSLDEQSEFWALRDVNFSIRQGEVVGVIGHNGAGKSTLLKILSRITDPSAGIARIRGRVGSLLEVGTGFHSELTGRENVYLSGAILGMSKQEVNRNFDAIVDFAGVDKFIDTPVKHYSSGMWVRLGFAVAAHLEPEILLVDEVLAVGDVTFQKKCLGKMHDVATGGRTVLFVSHNMAAVENLCTRCIWLKNGRVEQTGETDEVITAYLAAAQSGRAADLSQHDRRGSGPLRFDRCWLTNQQGEIVDAVACGDEFSVHLQYCVRLGEAAKNVIAAAIIKDPLGATLFTLSTHLTHADQLNMSGSGSLRCRVPSLPLAAGGYVLNLWSSVSGQLSDEVANATRFTVTDSDIFRTGKVPQRHLHGAMIVPHHWQVGPCESTDKEDAVLHVRHFGDQA